MAKCEICKAKIEETFLKKILGTYVKDEKGKKHLVCPECQKKLSSKEEILKTL
jgi:DNA-directed RNA polymerase subunit RPC12/RpoP